MGRDVALSRPTYYLAIVNRKLHENEKIIGTKLNPLTPLFLPMLGISYLRVTQIGEIDLRKFQMHRQSQDKGETRCSFAMSIISKIKVAIHCTQANKHAS